MNTNPEQGDEGQNQGVNKTGETVENTAGQISAAVTTTNGHLDSNINNMNAQEVLNKLSEGNSLIYQALNAKGVEYVEELMKHKTPYGSDLLHLIASGLERPACHIGIYVDGAETYNDPVFGPLLADIIKLYHNFDPAVQKHEENFDISGLEVGDLNAEQTEKVKVLSMRVRYAFCLDNLPFQSVMTRDQRKQGEGEIVNVLDKLEGDAAGKYESLETMTPERREQLVNDHILSWTEHDEDLVSSKIASDWPNGRGVFLSNDGPDAGQIFVLVNDEDNRVGVLQKGGNIKTTFEKLAKINDAFNNGLNVARDPKYGKLVSCPTNIGTGMRLSALVTLPILANKNEVLKQVALKYGLSVRGLYGENSKAGEGGEVDISNKARLGISEREIVDKVYHGTKILMDLEKKLQADPDNTDAIIAEFMNS